MFLSSFSRSFTAGIISTLRPTALRLYSSVGGISTCIGTALNNMCAQPQGLLCKPKKSNCIDIFGSIKPTRQSHASKDLKLETAKQPWTGSWEYPAECCGNPCPELLPRFDSLYYRPTDKAKRQYQQTWVECPPLQIRRRKVSCNDSNKLPPLYRRKQPDKFKGSCSEFDISKLKSLFSMNSNSKCYRTQIPCCIRGRYPPSCKRMKGNSNCKKDRCPYPSMSECCLPFIPPPKITECNCMSQLARCDAYRYLKRKLIFSLPPAMPAWPPKLD